MPISIVEKKILTNKQTKSETSMGKNKAPENETKAHRFKRVGEIRLNKAIKAISNLGKLSNTSIYEFSEEQEKKLISSVDSAIQLVKQKFASKKGIELVSL